jgi:hypothetical protein
VVGDKHVLAVPDQLVLVEVEIDVSIGLVECHWCVPVLMLAGKIANGIP